MIERKQRLYEVVALKAHPDQTKWNKKIAVAKLLTKYDWSLSAYGIFEVDCKLISGVSENTLFIVISYF